MRRGDAVRRAVIGLLSVEGALHNSGNAARKA